MKIKMNFNQRTVLFKNLNVTLQDFLFLSLVVVFSLILYVWHLGFYSDDWSFLGYFSLSQDQSLIGLFRSVYSPHVQMRPVQILYLAGLYWLFGSHPLGYHLVNAAVLLSGILLFYLVLRELGQSRLLALTVPVVYALLPHYSTNRFWVASFQITLSMTLYFLSLYSDLRGIQAREPLVWSWKVLSIISLLGSGLAYEIFLPLFLLNPLVVWYRSRQLDSSSLKKPLVWWKFSVLSGINILLVIQTLLFKAQTTTRMGNKAGLMQQMLRVAKNAVSLKYDKYDYGLNIKQAITVHYGDYGLGLPHAVCRIVWDYPNIGTFALAGVLALGIFKYLHFTARQGKAQMPSRTHMLRYIILGLVVFGLGYMIFLTTFQLQFSSTGIANRTAMAAAVGVAISLVGGIGWVSTFLPSDRLRRSLFCILVSLLCTSGFLINNTLASFWITAYRQEQAVLADIRRQFPTLPAGSTLILDGVCPYVGPAIIFESSWDLAGALMMFYRDYTLKADIVTPNLKVKGDGLSTSLYGIYGAKENYPYEKLFIYHFDRKTTHQITDAKSAYYYFQTFNTNQHNTSCPEGHAGLGVPVF
ncbi:MULTISPECIES: hypothetical protein [unclassified Coleofasciculus]|uniref:hypothetical protein n=1 Tax=unclassified Coleofasciculus TaxID=2692782 RepID=UPI00187DF8CB|nr:MULTISPECIES: hypothetical protein [unclassified Coleofasciculus]MBE9127586.1 hypothetical protein [Coleofasciculus sp. LEGE 07081]MBE9149783.1 hypothetical protein [Coleofasciculus sp. LEGE 07092]